MIVFGIKQVKTTTEMEMFEKEFCTNQIQSFCCVVVLPEEKFEADENSSGKACGKKPNVLMRLAQLLGGVSLIFKMSFEYF